MRMPFRSLFLQPILIRQYADRADCFDSSVDPICLQCEQRKRLKRLGFCHSGFRGGGGQEKRAACTSQMLDVCGAEAASAASRACSGTRPAGTTHTCDTHIQHTHTYTHIYIYIIYVYIWYRTHRHKPVHVHIHTYTQTNAHVYTYVHTYTQANAHVYTYVHTYTQTNAHVYTYAHTARATEAAGGHTAELERLAEAEGGGVKCRCALV
jgi:hypothetical protein